MAVAAGDRLKQARAASGINTLLGLWLIISPWFWGYFGDSLGGVWNSVIVGAAVTILAFLRARAPRSAASLSWINLVLGLWTIVSPWIYAYADNGPRMSNNLIVGALIAALAIWSGSATAAARHQAHA